jgi:gamma-glutamylcyclotransferase (GGCT)/AIG2-like uncharacterized protein YtfP
LQGPERIPAYFLHRNDRVKSSMSKSDIPPQHLFVYGTLMRGSRNPMSSLLNARAIFMGEASIAGRLYNLGSFPGAVPDGESKSRIWGHAYLIRNAAVMAALDRYEGCGPNNQDLQLFRREQTRIVFANRKEVDGWVYAFIGAACGRPLIHRRRIQGHAAARK